MTKRHSRAGVRPIKNTSLLCGDAKFSLGIGERFDGGCEFVCYVDRDSNGIGHWYGYVASHPSKQCYFSAIVSVHALIVAETSDAYLESFHRLTRELLLYEPTRGDGFAEVYREAEEFISAKTNLAQLISSRKRDVDDYLPPDFRVADAIGWRGVILDPTG